MFHPILYVLLHVEAIAIGPVCGRGLMQFNPCKIAVEDTWDYISYPLLDFTPLNMKVHLCHRLYIICDKEACDSFASELRWSSDGPCTNHGACKIMIDSCCAVPISSGGTTKVFLHSQWSAQRRVRVHCIIWAEHDPSPWFRDTKQFYRLSPGLCVWRKFKHR